MGLGKLSTADDLHPESIEMHVLALNHANHHPAKCLQVTGISPHKLTLTQNTVQRIIESGSGSHIFAVECGNFPA